MKPDRRVALLPLAACILAALACTRSDVPSPGGIGAGAATDLAASPTETGSRVKPFAVEPAEAAADPSSLAPQPELAASPTDAPVAPSSVEPSPTATARPTATPVTPTATPNEPEPLVSPTFPPTATVMAQNPSETVLYRTQPGDVLRSIAVRFGVLPQDVISSDGKPLSEDGLLSANRILFIPRRLGPTGPSDPLLPDSEIIFSPHAIDFDIEGFVDAQGGYLSHYHEFVSGHDRTGAQVVALAARDHSINPRILLALLEYHSGWVTQPDTPRGDSARYPLGHISDDTQGLYRQLTWAANALGTGYYDWRSGTLTEMVFPDSSIVRLAPELNAGTVALQYYFSLFVSGRDWAQAISGDGFIQSYWHLFGDPFDYAHPIYEDGLHQPDLILPFIKGHIWAFTGGPHGAWEAESAWAALDFAPSSITPGCFKSDEWVVAAAAGIVVRVENGVVVLDLDGDGQEQSGWSLLYLHIDKYPLVKVGDLVEQGDLIGHPSCNGGVATGTHVHIARKYNGEWILADGPLPFTLSGWVAKAGSQPYQGALIQGDQVVLACSCASQVTYIKR